MLTLRSRAIATAAASAIALSTVGLIPAAADGFYPPAGAPPPAVDTQEPYVYPNGRYGQYGQYRYGQYADGDGAAAAAVLALFGTVAAIIASRQHRRHVYNYGAINGPVYGGPVHVPRGINWRHRHHR